MVLMNISWPFNNGILVLGGLCGLSVDTLGRIGASGNQVLEWVDLVTEIKTAGLHNVSQ